MKRYGRWATVLLVIYSGVMVWLLFGQRLGALSFADYAERLSHNYNLVPFKTIAELIALWQSGRLVTFTVINFFGNIGMFIPLGLLPCVFPSLRRWVRFLLCVAAIILVVELVQFFPLLGVGDIDDLLLNVIGGAIGFALFRLISRNDNNG